MPITAPAQPAAWIRDRDAADPNSMTEYRDLRAPGTANSHVFSDLAEIPGIPTGFVTGGPAVVLRTASADPATAGSLWARRRPASPTDTAVPCHRLSVIGVGRGP